MSRSLRTDPDYLTRAIERFKSKCEFCPYTGCVIWQAGKVRGQGHLSWYGAWWAEGKNWRAHRWAAWRIHGLDIHQIGTQVDHCCPMYRLAEDQPLLPNPLCVHHLQVMPADRNRELQWIRAQVGADEPPDLFKQPDDLGPPFYTEPEWMR